MSHENPVTIQVSRQEIDTCDTSGVSIILESFVPHLLERNRNRVQIKVRGFGNDKRELFDIPEVRKYFTKLFDDNPGLFYWIDIDSYMFVFLGLMLFEPYRVNDQVTLTPQICSPTLSLDSRVLMSSVVFLAPPLKKQTLLFRRGFMGHEAVQCKTSTAYYEKGGPCPPHKKKPMNLSLLLQQKRRQVLQLAQGHGAWNVRLFGSVARGEATEASELDLLIEMEPERCLLDVIAIKQDLEELLGCKVDVVTEAAISPYLRDKVLHEAVRL